MGNFWQKRYWYGAILLILSILLLLFCWNNWDILRFFTFSDPEEYDVLGWNISVQKEETGLSLAVSPLS
jgi:hypothetical protein